MKNARKSGMETNIGRILDRVVPIVALAVVFALAVPTHVHAATIIVPDDHTTIQQAVNAANPGDTVFVRSGTYFEHVTIGKSLALEGENRDTTIVDGVGTGKVVAVISTSNVTISKLTIRNGGSSEAGDYKDAGIALHGTSDSLISDCIVTLNGLNGLYLCHSSSNTIRNCDFSYNDTKDSPGGGIQGAIHLRYSSYNTIADNNVYSNTYRGITVRSSSNYTTITGNDAHSNPGWGIHLGWSNYCTVSGNNTHDNGTGIFLDAARYNTISDNVICSNIGTGVYAIYYSHHNIIVGNIIKSNSFGIDMWYGYGIHSHQFYHNDVIDNATQVRGPAEDQYWDDGYPSGGNYWSDYVGTDIFSGPGQNVPGSDGIGDTPYSVTSIAKDNYPLINPWISVITVAIDIKPGSYPNAINLGSLGLIPVAILSSDDFDATEVDPETVELAGSGVTMRGKSNKYMAHEEDVNIDGLLDLVVQFVTENLNPDDFQDGYAILTGETFDGELIQGQDEITIVPPE